MPLKLENYLTKGKTYTHQSLNGGKYNIPKNKREELFKHILKNPHVSLCERLPERFPLYFDIDKLNRNYDIEIVKKFIDNTLLENIEDDGNKDYLESYVLMNQKKNQNFHIHYPNIIVNKKSVKQLIKLLNKEIKYQEYFKDSDEIFDSQAYNTCFRMYGTWKNNKSEMKNTNYDFVNDDEKDENEMDNFYKLTLLGYENNELMNFKNFNTKNIEEKKTYDINYDSETQLDKESYEYIELSRNNWEHTKTILFKCLKKEVLEKRDLWIQMLYVLKYIGVPIEIALEWSEKYKNHDQNRINQLESIYNMELDMEKIQAVGAEYYFVNNYNMNKREFNKINFGLDLKTWKNFNIKYLSFDKYITAVNSNLFTDDAEIIKYILKNKVINKNQGKNNLTYLWDGDLWLQNNNKLRLFIYNILTKFYKKKIKSIENDKNLSPENKESYIKKINLKLNKKFNNMNYTDNILLIILDAFTDMNHKNIFNLKEHLFPVTNGNIDLRTGELVHRKYDDYFTMCRDIEYNPDADISSVKSFMNSIFLDNEILIEFVNKLFGYCLTGSVEEQIFTILYGNGSNGKSVLCESIEEVLSTKFFTKSNSKIFTQDIKLGSATPHLSKLVHKRIAFIEEFDKNAKFKENVVKDLTGSKTLSYRKLYSEEEEIQMSSKFLIATNEIPCFSNTEAMTRRLVFIPFDATFVNKERYDENNKSHKLKAPMKEVKEMLSPEKLLKWLVLGSMKYYKEGLSKRPEIVKKFTSKIIQEVDTFSKYFQEETILTENVVEHTPINDVYIDYLQYSSIRKKDYTLLNFKNDIKKTGIIKNLKNHIHKLPLKLRINEIDL